MTTPRILALGGGGWGRYGVLTPLERYALDLSGAGSTPRVCYLPTASGDEAYAIRRFHEVFPAPRFAATHLAVFPYPTVPDVREHLLAQDLVWVGGGNTANMLALWALHGVGDALHEAWQAGVVLAGGSAGSLCWFVGGPTDSYGPELRPLTNGLGFLPDSHCPHYDSEARRRPTYHRLIGDGTLPGGWAVEDGVAVLFEGTAVAEVVADHDGGHAYRVDRGTDGGVEEQPTPGRPLPWG